jgi:hypothetical protein
MGSGMDDASARCMARCMGGVAERVAVAGVGGEDGSVSNCRLREFVTGLRTGGISVCSDPTLHTFRRTEQAHEYARLCDAIAANDT